jgi:hypothetical protein
MIKEKESLVGTLEKKVNSFYETDKNEKSNHSTRSD